MKSVVLWLVVLCSCIGVVGFFLNKVRGVRKVDESRLLAACFGDRAKMERLIGYELRRVGGSRAQAVERAYESLFVDRGRYR